MKRVYLTILLILLSLLFSQRIQGDNLKYDYFKTRLNDNRLGRKDKINAIDSLIKYSDGPTYSLYNNKAQLLYEEGDYAASMETYKMLRDIAPEDSLRLRLFAEAKIGIMKFTMSNFRGALESIYKVLETPKPDSLRYIEHYAYFSLIDFYTTAGNYPLARKYIDLGLTGLPDIPESKNFPKTEKNRFHGIWHRTLASHFLTIGEPDKAYLELKKAEKYPAHIDGLMTSYVIYAAIARKKGDNEMAEGYLQKALDIETDNFNKTFVLVNYMDLLLATGRARDAVLLTNKYSETVDKVKGSPLEPDYLFILGKYYSMTGDHSNEVKTLYRIITTRDSIYRAMVMWEAEELAGHYENEKKEHIIANLKKENQKRMWLVLAVSVTGVVAVLVAIYTWRRHRKVKMNATALGDQIITQETQHKEALRESAESLTLRNQQLSSMTMYMARLDEALSQIKGLAHDKSMPDEKRLSVISSVVNELSRQDNVWNIFRTYFESINQSFFNNLYKNHPDLTNGEVRMCAFILMGLSNKEIAAMTNRSVRTVEVVKHNIRKKFGITETTESYIRSLASSENQS